MNSDSIWISSWASFIEATDDLAFLKDASLTYLAVSSAFVRTTGKKSADDILGRTDAEIFRDGEFSAHLMDGDRSIIQAGQPMKDVVQSIKHDGNYIYYSVSKYPVRGPDGSIIGLFAIGSDVTDDLNSKMEQSERRHSEIRQRFTDEGRTTAIWDLDIVNRRVFVRQDSGRYGLGTVIDNVPECFIQSGTVHPDSVEGFRRMYADMFSGKAEAEGIFRFRSADGSRDYYDRIHYTAVNTIDGKPWLAVGMSEDITDKIIGSSDKTVDMADIFAPDILLTALMDITANKIMSHRFRDKSTSELYKQTTVSGFSKAFAAANLADDAVNGIFASFSAPFFFKRYKEGKLTLSMEYRRKLEGGVVRWVRDESQLLTDPENGHLLMRLTIRDIDDDHRRLDELSKAAETDSMTSLYNHFYTMTYMENYLENADNTNTSALFMVDVDDFKSVNDNLGHQQGDEIIRSLASVIIKTFRSSDILGRVGGDEFLILMKDVPDLDTVRRKAAELVSALQFTCHVDGHSVQMSGSVGISVNAGSVKALSLMVSEADTALYSSKKRGKGCFSIFDDPAVPSDDCQSLRVKRDTIQLQALMENIDGGVTIAEVGNDIVMKYMSPSFLKIADRTVAETGVLGENLFTFVADDDLAGLKQAMQTVAKTGQAADHIYRVKGKNGIGWRHMRAARLESDEPGDTPRVISVVTDITRFQESTSQLEAIVANSPCGIGIFTLGSSLHSIFVNDTLLTMLHCTRQQYNDASDGDFKFYIAPADLDGVMRQAADALTSSNSFEVTFHTANLPTEAVIKARCVKLSEPDGEPVLLVMLSDITWESKMAEELRFAEARYRTAAEQLACMIWEVDVFTRTLVQTGEDPLHLGLSGQNYENAPEGLLSTGLVHPESVDEFNRMFDNIYSGNDKEEYILRCRDQSGVYGWHKARFRLLRRDDGTPFYAIGVSEMVPNIDDDMRRFEQEQRFAQCVSQWLSCTARANLSRDEMEWVKMTGYGSIDRDSKMSYDDFKNKFLNAIRSDDDRQKIEEVMCRQNLRQQFSNGNTWIQKRFLYSGEGSGYWMSVSINLLRHPVSGDMLGFFYIRDTNVPITWESNIGFDMTREPSTLLYSRMTYERMAKALISSGLKPGLTALMVFRINGLEKIKQVSGDSVARNVLFDVGRILRMITAPETVVGFYDEDYFQVFRDGVKSRQAMLDEIDEIHERFDSTFRALHPTMELAFTVGVTFADSSDANYPRMLSLAIADCPEANID